MATGGKSSAQPSAAAAKHAAAREPEADQNTDQLPLEDRIAEVWGCESAGKQRKKVAEIFHLTTGAGICRESLDLDFTYYALLFAKDMNFDSKKTVFFYRLMLSLRDAVTEPNSSIDSTAAVLRKLLLEPFKTSAEKIKIVNPVYEDENKPEEDEKKKKSKKKEKGGKKGKKKRNFKAKAEAEEKKRLEERKKAEKKKAMEEEKKGALMFTHVEVKKIIDHVTSTLLGHFSLYKAVFTDDFIPEKKTVTFSTEALVHIDSREEKYDLNEGTEELKKEEPAKSELSPEVPTMDTFQDDQLLNGDDKIANLVKAQLVRAQEQMNKSLADNAAALESKFKEFQSKIEEQQQAQITQK